MPALGRGVDGRYCNGRQYRGTERDSISSPGFGVPVLDEMGDAVPEVLATAMLWVSW